MLVFQKRLGSRSLALGVESRVKKLSKARKEELIRANTRIDEIIKQISSQLTVQIFQPASRLIFPDRLQKIFQSVKFDFIKSRQ
jgi:hypothetical protein